MLQRDLTVLALRTWLHQRPAPAVVLDAMAGSGVRALRYLLEVPQVGTAVANDSSQLALAAIGTNALLSGLRPAGAQQYTASDGSVLETSRSDATAYMHAHAGRFDALCLDPCGSVAELLPAAVRCLKVGGLLPLSPCTSVHLPTSPYPPTSPYISLYLPISPNISLYLPGRRAPLRIRHGPRRDVA